MLELLKWDIRYKGHGLLVVCVCYLWSWMGKILIGRLAPDFVYKFSCGIFINGAGDNGV